MRPSTLHFKQAMPSSFALLGLVVLLSSVVVRGAVNDDEKWVNPNPVQKFSFSLQDTQYYFPEVAAVRTAAMVGMVKL